MKDQLRKIIINRLIPNLIIENGIEKIGIYPPLNKYSLIVTNSNFTNLGFTNLIEELCIRYFIDGRDVARGILTLIPDNEKLPPANRSHYKLYFAGLNKNINEEFMFYRKETIDFQAVAPHYPRTCLQSHPENFNKITDLLSKCKPFDIIKFDYNSQPFDFGYGLTFCNNSPPYHYSYYYKYSYFINIEQSQSLKKGFKDMNYSLIKFVESLEHISVRSMYIGFAFCIINDTIHCFVAAGNIQTSRKSAISSVPPELILLFLEPIELIPENKKEKRNLFLLWSALMEKDQ
jgi:hypothetical protein